jgi:hypothetical protein
MDEPTIIDLVAMAALGQQQSLSVARKQSLERLLPGVNQPSAGRKRLD